MAIDVSSLDPQLSQLLTKLRNNIILWEGSAFLSGSSIEFYAPREAYHRGSDGNGRILTLLIEGYTVRYIRDPSKFNPLGSTTAYGPGQQQYESTLRARGMKPILLTVVRDYDNYLNNVPGIDSRYLYPYYNDAANTYVGYWKGCPISGCEDGMKPDESSVWMSVCADVKFLTTTNYSQISISFGGSDYAKQAYVVTSVSAISANIL